MSARTKNRIGIDTLLILTLISVLATLTLAKAVVLHQLATAGGARELTDFDVFHVAARMIWRGEATLTYAAATMGEAQRALANGVGLVPWAYPPPFLIAIAPLGLLPLGLAALLFLALPLAAFLVVLRRLAGPDFGLALAACFPALLVNGLIGQNGYLSGALLGWACLLLLSGGGRGGLPLGLMVFKPHLAIPFALEALLNRRGRVIAVALATVAAGVLAATLGFGGAIWPAFRTGVAETSAFLASGAFPLFRMVSVYAFVRSLGAPAGLALAVHGAFALLVLGLIAQGVRRALPARTVLGLCALASPFISPYAYLYDLPVLGVGIALLAPQLRARMGRAGLAGFVGLCALLSGAGYLQPKLFPGDVPGRIGGDAYDRISLAGMLLPLAVLLLWRALRQRPTRQPDVNGGEATPG